LKTWKDQCVTVIQNIYCKNWLYYGCTIKGK